MLHCIKSLFLCSLATTLAASAAASSLIPPEDVTNLLYYPHCNLSSGACIIPADKDYAVLTVDPNGPTVCDVVIRTAGLKLEAHSDLASLHRITPYLYREDRRLQYKFLPLSQADGSLALSLTAQRGTRPLLGLYLKAPGSETFAAFLQSQYKHVIGLHEQAGLIAFPILCSDSGR